MDPPNPFSLPGLAPHRKHGPAGYINYQEYPEYIQRFNGGLFADSGVNEETSVAHAPGSP